MIRQRNLKATFSAALFKNKCTLFTYPTASNQCDLLAGRLVHLQMMNAIFASVFLARSAPRNSDFVSQFTVETYCFADGRCLFKQPRSIIFHCNQYDEIPLICELLFYFQ